MINDNIKLLKLSDEIFNIPLGNDKYIIYAPLRRSAFIGNSAAVNFIAKLEYGKLYDHIISDSSIIKFLISLNIISATPEKIPNEIFSGEPEPTYLTLFLTTKCNLRCKYCYAKAGDKPPKSMDIGIAKRGIDFIVCNAIKKNKSLFQLAFHGGGEPTINWKVLTLSKEYAQNKAKKHGLGLKTYSATNGVLSDLQIEWFLKNLNGCTVSFDGLPEIHDNYRLRPGGQGSSEQVMHTIRCFDDANFDYQLRITVVKEQIARLIESIEFICAFFHPKRILVEPAYQLGRWKNAPSSESYKFIEYFRKARETASQHKIDLFFSEARIDTLTNHFCGISQDNFSLSPEGNVSGCYEVFSEDDEWAKTFFYGKKSNNCEGYSFNLKILNHLRKQIIQYREYCRECFAKWNCGGGCYHKALMNSSNLEFSGSNRCFITQELTKDQIIQKIVDAGGIFWHEAPR